MKYSFDNKRTDLFLDNDIYKLDTKIKVFKKVVDKHVHKTIYFNNLDDSNKIINMLSMELLYFFKKFKIKNNYHVFVVGLGNELYTADSVGPNTIKHVKVNSYLKNLNNVFDGNIVSALVPGVMGYTGIKTSKIIKSVVKDIKPDLVILIDSFVSSNINYLNKTIEINDVGINPGCGIIGFSERIDEKFLNTKVITIGVTTAIELNYSNNIPYIMSSKDIDKYVDDISFIIASSINNVIYNLI